MKKLFWCFVVLATVLSAFAIISLTEKTFALGLHPAMAEIVGQYRGLVHPVFADMFGWVRLIWPSWEMPAWLKDTYALSFVGAFSAHRTAVMHRIVKTRREAARSFLVCLMLALCGLGGLLLLTPLIEDGDSGDAEAFAPLMFMLTCSVVAAIAFFAWGAPG